MPNKSLDASGTTGLVIDNLFVTWLFAAASTQTLCRRLNAMPFYTFIMEYAGGTYISQVGAPSEKSASVKWARQLTASDVQGLGVKGKESLIQQLKDQSPVPLTGTVNAWCTGALIRGNSALINIVQTDRNGNTRGGNLNARASA